ncbi:GNAT family acetyltransferase [Dyadobacter endophyticus]|uniref:GNAT family acetyltransferase n=1 Tax=Dyadobacter endophyticus TaxID=1749036 RepID=A0ABQ1ZD71_9BACT|nr:GNAT family N-acetyltransferase [Dyadobacter endophyticus]GGH55199.1 GNAT family acetyltransferase [Dyadobacter endophyticus]
MTAQLTFVQKTGERIADVFDDLARLRIAVFRDYPYLYEGSVEYEKGYLQTYLQSGHSFLFAVYDGNTMIGATTCIPLKDETAEIRKPFEDAEFDAGAICYFGESILLPAYRGLGLGHRFFDEREAHARSLGGVKTCCFCSVDRGENHPLKPAGYRSNDAFWLKRGYRQEPALQSIMEWPDLGESVSTPKTMIFWTKPLNK